MAAEHEPPPEKRRLPWGLLGLLGLIACVAVVLRRPGVGGSADVAPVTAVHPRTRERGGASWLSQEGRRSVCTCDVGTGRRLLQEARSVPGSRLVSMCKVSALCFCPVHFCSFRSP